MNQRNETDVLKGEDWDGLYADVPDAVVAGVEASLARIHRRERRARFALRAMACAAVPEMGTASSAPTQLSFR